MLYYLHTIADNMPKILPMTHSSELRSLRTYERPIKFNPELSISAARDEIIAAWNQHQILFIQSETGSGKSTQIPKIALQSLELFEGQSIAITQPRRLATQLLASRLNQELGAPPGEAVGFQVRHQNCTRPQHFIKVMTEGILVQEAASDPLLSQYRVIILDEVHERSISIDLICGLLKYIIPRRPDLKIALLSATLEKEVFSSFFPTAHFLYYPGRSFPIQDYYWEGPLETPVLEKIIWAIDLLAHDPQGDILMFCATEAEIHGLKASLEAVRPAWDYHVLYSRLNPLKQNIVTKGQGNERRFILSTNIAETSLTIPGLSAVIDLGTQKIMQYNPQLRVNSYPIVPITQASIAQRRGRAGRLQEGTCFHLYSAEDEQSRPRDRTPEIQRSSLAHVLLKILMFGQQSLARFSFVSPPHPPQMKEALQTLTLLGLIDSSENLTALGKYISHDPVDPRFGVILQEAKKLRVETEIIIIIAFLSTNDPRLRPVEKKNEALQAHLKDRDYRSDFLTILNLYQRIERDTKALSKRKFHQYCNTHFLQPYFIEQWKVMIDELARAMHMTMDPLWAEKELNSLLIHRSLIAGFFDKIFMLQEDGLYRGAKGIITKTPLPEIGKMKKPPWIFSIAIESFHHHHRLKWVGPIQPMDLLHYGARQITSQCSNWTYCDQKRAAYLTESFLLWGLKVAGPKRRWAQISDLQARSVAITGLVLQYYPEHFVNIPQWFSSFDTAMKIAQRTQFQHLMRTPNEVIEMAQTLWPMPIIDGASLDLLVKEIPTAPVEWFFVGPLPCQLSDLPEQIAIGTDTISVRYAEPEEIHEIELSLPESLWNRYHPSAWITLHPYYLKQIVEALLAQLPKAVRAQGESLSVMADFFLSEYQWPQDLLSHLKTFLYQYYDIHPCHCVWSYNQIPKRWVPTIWVESAHGDLHWMGGVDQHTDSLHAQSRICTSQIRDRDQEMYESFRSGLYRYIAADQSEEILFSKKDFFEWKNTLLKDYAQYIYSVSTITFPGILKKSDTLKIIEMILGGHILHGANFLLSSIEERSSLKSSYETFWKRDKSTIDRILSFIKIRKNIVIPQAIWAQSACSALQSGAFLHHLSPEVFRKIELWIPATGRLDLRMREKPQLCMAFVTQWQDFLKASKILEHDDLKESHPIWAVWFEWMMALIFQPYHPLRPLSLKRALLLVQETQNFRSPWS